MKFGEFDISDDLVQLVHKRWPLRYAERHPDALRRPRDFGDDQDVIYRGVLCCDSVERDGPNGDVFGECGARIVPDDFRGLLNHLLTFHGYRMDGNQYDNQNQIIRHASTHWA